MNNPFDNREIISRLYFCVRCISFVVSFVFKTFSLSSRIIHYAYVAIVAAHPWISQVSTCCADEYFDTWLLAAWLKQTDRQTDAARRGYPGAADTDAFISRRGASGLRVPHNRVTQDNYHNK